MLKISRNMANNRDKPIMICVLLEILHTLVIAKSLNIAALQPIVIAKSSVIEILQRVFPPVAMCGGVNASCRIFLFVFEFVSQDEMRD